MIAQGTYETQTPAPVSADRLLYSRVLVPLDGSALAEEALPVAIALAQQAETTGKVILLPLHLTECIISSRDGPVAVPAVVSQGIDAYLAQLEAGIQAQGVAVEIVQTEGDLVSGLAALARDHQANLLVMVTHTGDGMNRVIPGSIAERLLKATPIPMLLLKQGEGAALKPGDIPNIVLHP